MVAFRGSQRFQSASITSNQQRFRNQPIAIVQFQATLAGNCQQICNVLRSTHAASGAINDDSDAMLTDTVFLQKMHALLEDRRLVDCRSSQQLFRLTVPSRLYQL
jgi:hypothetical protein